MSKQTKTIPAKKTAVTTVKVAPVAKKAPAAIKKEPEVILGKKAPRTAKEKMTAVLEKAVENISKEEVPEKEADVLETPTALTTAQLPSMKKTVSAIKKRESAGKIPLDQVMANLAVNRAPRAPVGFDVSRFLKK